MSVLCQKENADGSGAERHPVLDGAGRILFLLTAGMLCGYALVTGVQTVWLCQWPAEWDALRDISMAQSILDGRYPEDPILQGETLWYNPLTGFLIALIGHVSGLPLHRASIIIGPFVNLIAPAGAVALLALLFGRAAAVAGLCVLLFAKEPQTAFWVHACYSPWLLAPLYSLGLLFLTFFAYYRGFLRRSLGWFVVAGILLGITFMAHTAPAIIAGGTMLLFLLVESVIARYDRHRGAGKLSTATAKEATTNGGSQWRRLPVFFLVLLATAFMISLPYTWSILWNYHFRVHNPFPSLFAVDYVSISHFPERLRDALNWRNIVALPGVVILIRRFREHREARFVICWSCVAAAFLCQHYLWQVLLARGVVLTGLVPGHHAFIHIGAARAVWFAVGATALGETAAMYMRRGMNRSAGMTDRLTDAPLTRRLGALSGALLAGLALYLSNPLTTRADFQPPQSDLYYQFHERNIPMYKWILENTSPDAVFLCEDESIGMTVVMPAARKLVAAMLLYSNPYVPAAPLFDAQAALLDAMEQGDRAAFCAQARHYPDLYLLIKKPRARQEYDQFSAFFEERARKGDLIVWRARPCEE